MSENKKEGSGKKKVRDGASSKNAAKFLDGQLWAKMAVGGAMSLRSNADEVNRLNVFPVPDGDTGDNMRMTIESGIAALENIDSDDLAEVMKVLSHGMLLGARGNSGVILSQLFAGIAKGFESSQKADATILGNALQMGVKQAYTSVMTPTEGTILTVAREAVDYAVSRINAKSTIRSLFADLVKEMRASLNRTPEVLLVLKEAGVVDSGGAGLLYIMDGFNRVLNGETIEGEAISSALNAEKKPALSVSSFGPDSEMTYGYCTELLLQLQRRKTDIDRFDIDGLKTFLAGIGDSIVAFQTESIVKIHVHTLTPEKVLAHCREFGEFLTVKIENMSVQHTSLGEGGEETDGEPTEGVEHAESTPEASKRYGLVAVSNGPGVESLFREFGVDEIVQGGQTQNPSTNDFLNAFSRITAEHIFVFPNNGNILMAAQQAAEIYENAQVHVIPTKNIGTGYVAISTMDFDNPDTDAVIAQMKDAMGRVVAGYVSPSIRNADMNGIHINNGDTIGIIEKEIVVSNCNKTLAVRELISKLLESDEKSMLTVFCGKDSTQEEREELQKYLAEQYGNIESYLIDGGQDIYPFIFVAE